MKDVISIRINEGEYTKAMVNYNCKTPSELVQILIKEASRRSPKKINTNGIGLDDINPNMIRIFCTARFKFYDKTNLIWIEDQIKNKDDAPRILLLLNNLRKWQMKQPEDNEPDHKPEVPAESSKTEEPIESPASDETGLPMDIVDEFRGLILQRKRNALRYDRSIMKGILEEKYPLEASMAGEAILDIVYSLIE